MPSRAATILAWIVWLGCAVYAAGFVYRGWIPHDEGTIGQTAERTLSGQVPHRDFDDTYTGGLTYLHAAGMKALGVNLRAPRLILFAFFLAFLAATYAIARRLTSASGGLAAMLLCTVWSVPNYFVSLPSWYNLFFATFGTLALLHFLDGRRRAWLLTAGVCGGLSVLAKIAGIFYLAGGLLFLVYVAHEESVAARGHDTAQNRSRLWLLLGLPIGLCVLLLVLPIVAGLVAPALAQLAAPVVAVSILVVWLERRTGAGPTGARCRQLLGLLWPFAAGAALPIAGFVLWYWREHAVAELIRGVLVLPGRRLAEASLNPPTLAGFGLAVPYALLLLTKRRPAPAREPRLAVFGLMIGLAIVLAFAGQPIVYRAVWAIARSLPAIVVLTGVWMLIDRSPPLERDRRKRSQLFLVLVMSAMVALVQFPYATPTYFCYAAPMTVIAAIALVSSQDRPRLMLHLCVGAFFFCFAVLYVNRSYGWNLGVAFIPYHPQSRLDLDRGGLLVPAHDKDVYEQLVATVRAHADGGTIYAAPDCPEVYFLSGFPNPSRAIFDFLTPVREDAGWMASLLAQTPIHVVVVNTDPLFSPRLNADVLALLEARFPYSRQVGQFVVRFDIASDGGPLHPAR